MMSFVWHSEKAKQTETGSTPGMGWEKAKGSATKVHRGTSAVVPCTVSQLWGWIRGFMHLPKFVEWDN